MQNPHASPDETQTLRHCVRELAALSTLSAVWSSSAPHDIAEGLSRVLFRSLRLDLVVVRVNGLSGSVAVEAARTRQGPIAADHLSDINSAFEPLLKNRGSGSTAEVDNPFGEGTLRVAITPLGYEGDCGFLIAAAQSPDFPGPTDRLMLGVAANQAAIVLQQRRSQDRIRRSEQELSDFFENATVGLHWVGPGGERRDHPRQPGRVESAWLYGR
jgi:GAF domain-containing protein